MHKILSELSFLIRMYLCYLTIDKIPILSNQLLNYILLETISLYTILRLISYYEVNRMYNGEVETISGTITYFFVYIFNLGIMYVLLLLCTKIGLLPINC